MAPGAARPGSEAASLSPRDGSSLGAGRGGGWGHAPLYVSWPGSTKPPFFLCSKIASFLGGGPSQGYDFIPRTTYKCIYLIRPRKAASFFFFLM